MIIQPIDKDIIDIANRRIFWKAGDNITQHITITAETDPRIVSVYEKLVMLQEIKDKLGDIALVSDRMLSVEAVAQNIDNLKALLALDLQEFNSKLEDAVAKATEASENVKVYGTDIEALKAKDTELAETIDTKKNEVVELIDAVDNKLQTEYATLVKLAEKLTKSEADVYYEAKGHSYSKEESDEKYLKKSDSVVIDAYTKQESDDKFEVKDNGYSKTASDERYAHKQDVASTYATKEELAQAQLGGGSGGSVDLSSYETKAHAEATYAAKTDLELKVNTTTYNSKMSSVDSKIKTLEDNVPNLATKSELEPLATKNELTSLATKSELTPLLSKAVADTLYAPIGSSGNIDTSDLVHRGEYNSSIQAIYQELSNKPSLNDAAKSWTSTYSSEKIEQAYEGMYAKIEGEINKASSVEAEASKLVRRDTDGTIKDFKLKQSALAYDKSIADLLGFSTLSGETNKIERIHYSTLIDKDRELLKDISGTYAETTYNGEYHIDIMDFKNASKFVRFWLGRYEIRNGDYEHEDALQLVNAPSGLTSTHLLMEVEKVSDEVLKITLLEVSTKRQWLYYYSRNGNTFTDFVEIKYGSDGVKINDISLSDSTTYSSSKIDNTYAKKQAVVSVDSGITKPLVDDIVSYLGENHTLSNRSFDAQYKEYIRKFFGVTNSIGIDLFGNESNSGDTYYNKLYSSPGGVHDIVGGMILSSMIQTPPIAPGTSALVPCNITSPVINLCNGYTFVGTAEVFPQGQTIGSTFNITFKGLSSPMNAFKSGLICLIMLGAHTITFNPVSNATNNAERYSVQWGSDSQPDDQEPSLMGKIYLYTYFIIPSLRSGEKAVVVLNKLKFPQEGFRG